jgi:fumarate reductase subunit C
MSTPKMPGLPMISFKDFVKNPIVALLFICLIAIGYLYLDNKTTLTNQVVNLQEEVKTLKHDYKELNDKFIQTLEKVK